MKSFHISALFSLCHLIPYYGIKIWIIDTLIKWCGCFSQVWHFHVLKRKGKQQLFSGACLTDTEPFAPLSPSNIYITDYTLLLYCHYAALRASEQHNGSNILPGTSCYSGAHAQVHSDAVSDSLPPVPFSNSFHFSPWYVFCSTPDMNPWSSWSAQVKAHPLFSLHPADQPCCDYFIPSSCLTARIF